MGFLAEAKAFIKGLIHDALPPEPDDKEPIYTEPDKVTTIGDVYVQAHQDSPPFAVAGARVNIYESLECSAGDEVQLVVRDPHSGQTLVTLFFIPAEALRLRALLAKPLKAP